MARRDIPHSGFPAHFCYPVSITRPAIPIPSKQPALRVCAPGAHHRCATPPDNRDIIHATASRNSRTLFATVIEWAKGEKITMC